jgi:hypothetical protein
MRPCTGLRAEAYRSVAALPDRVRRAKPHLTVRVLGDGTIKNVEVVLKYGLFRYRRRRPTSDHRNEPAFAAALMDRSVDGRQRSTCTPRTRCTAAAQSESLQQVAEFEAIAQNLLSHEEGPFWVERVAEVRLGSRAAASAGLLVRPVCPKLRKCRARPGSYAWCQLPTSGEPPLTIPVRHHSGGWPGSAVPRAWSPCQRIGAPL